MPSFKKSFQFAILKILTKLLPLLPMGLVLWMGRCLGKLGYHLAGRRRVLVYANLKTVFAGTLMPAQIRTMTREVFINFFQSIVELLCLPKLKRIGLEKFIDIQGKDNVDEALKKGKGVIFLAVHSGSWELASVVGGLVKGGYHVVVNDQSKFPQVDELLNVYRTIAGANVIFTGSAAKDIIKSLQRNEIISIVLDQGGKSGLEVPFLNRSSSMSTGAMRLALKYGCAVCPVWMERRGQGRHVLQIFPAMDVVGTADLESAVKANIIRAAEHFDALLRRHPTEYMWFYKVFKFSLHSSLLIIDDGRTGHLRQSQAVAGHLQGILRRKGRTVAQSTVVLQWRSPWSASLLSVYAFLSQFLGSLKKEDALQSFLTKACFEELMKHKADYIVSCGFQGAGVNYILGQNHIAKTVTIMTSGLLLREAFSAVVLPQHEKPQAVGKTKLIVPKVSPNLINAAYLKDQTEGLIKYYSHLKSNVRQKFGVLIGGNTQGVKFEEAQMRELLSQIKAAALHYNADILLTTSRRTPPQIEQIIAKELKDFERCALCILAGQRNIPEAVGGILGLADLVIVSGESVSMVSESVSSGKRTIVFSPSGHYKERPRNKYEAFVLKLNDQGYLMVTSVQDLKSKMAQLLSRKITLKSLDDEELLQQGLEAVA